MNSNFFVNKTASRLLTPFALFLAGTISFAGTAAQALTFKFNYKPEMDVQALTGFQIAADLWSSKLTDDVTVNLNIGFEQLESNILGQASSNLSVFSYLDVKNALLADKKSADDEIAVLNLPTQPFFDFFTTDQFGNFILDNNYTANNYYLAVNTANAKALSLLVDDGSADAQIQFNSDFNFDFDRNDGIGSGLIDFIGVAVHEIGHALGFVSGVDSVDYYSKPNGPAAPLDLNDYGIFSVLDLYRYSPLSVERGNLLLGQPVLDLAVGDTSVFGSRPPYFSLDQGRTNLGLFSTGEFHGDQQQASHWKDDRFTGEFLGILDPTYTSPVLDPLQPRPITALDMRSLDVIGWDVVSGEKEVPEPSSLVGLMALGLGFLFKRNQRCS